MLPRNTGWRPALWCLCPCINGSGFVAWFSCMFLLRGPASAFRFCQHCPAAPDPPVGLLGAPSPASGSLLQSSLRMYMSPSCCPPRLRSQGCVRAEGRGGVLPGLPLPCWCSAPQWQGPCASSSPLPPRMQELLRLPASVCPLEPVQCEGGRVCKGTQRGQWGGQGVWGSGALCPLLLPSPGRETLGSWPCYFSITEEIKHGIFL